MSVRFLGESEDSIRHFEINRPLPVLISLPFNHLPCSIPKRSNTKELFPSQYIVYNNWFLILILVYPINLKVTKFKDSVEEGSGIFSLTDLKYSKAPERPVYICTNWEKSNRYIFYRPMPLGWSLGIEEILDEDVNYIGKGFRSKGNRFYFKLER